MHEEVTQKTVEVRVFIAVDGKKFTTAAACEAHERELRAEVVRKQIRQERVDLDDDPTRGFPFDDVNIVAIQTVEQWEAWTGHQFPADRTFNPFITMEYSEEVDDHCRGSHYETRTMAPNAFADILENHAQRIRETVATVSRAAEEPKSTV
ncbi:MAG: hypothetical protein M1272_07875 [Firmicutes bacterium]|nr:hypothetical protein [Bacillota bacterium]